MYTSGVSCLVSNVMKIGIDASRAFLSRRTGIEEYSYQLIKHLRDLLPQDAVVVLYVRKKIKFQNWKIVLTSPKIDFDLPSHWSVKSLWAPRLWTQARLSLDILFHRPDVLLVPAHTVPLIHPRKTVVTIHGLEYEFSPQSYAWYERFYMRWSIRFSVRAASRVIAVSENTKRDLVQLYGVLEEGITVVYEGVDRDHQASSMNHQALNAESEILNAQYRIPYTKFFLFIGRLEERKNVKGIIEAFELFKTKTGLLHQLVLAGKPGYGYKYIKKQISKSKYQDQIIELGYVSEEEKWELLKKSEAFVFPSLYEGFGLPILEAQLVGTPVITSNTSSLPEVVGDGAIFVDPLATKKLARALVTLTTDSGRRADIIDKAAKNVDRFSWARCAREVAALLY